MQRRIQVSLALLCVLAGMAAGCTYEPPVRAPTPTPEIVYVTVLVTPTPALTPVATPVQEFLGTLTVSAQAFTGKATLNLDGNDTGTLTQSTPFTVRLPQGSHVIRVCVESVCDTEQVQVTALKTTTVDLSSKLSDLAANTKPSAKVVDTTPASNQILVSVQFSNPGQDDLTMTAVVVCPYQYGGGKLGSGTASGSGVARADVAAGGRVVTLVTIVLPDEIGTVYVSAIPTLSNFQYSNVVKK
jgi:hypothetical protein